MLRCVSLVAALVLGCAAKTGDDRSATTAMPTAPPSEPDDVALLLDDVIDRWLTGQPVSATAVGDHRFDDRWPDLSPAGIEADRRRILDDLARLQAVGRDRLAADQHVDLDILTAALELERFHHEVVRPWTNDPLFYVATFAAGIDDLVSRDYAPVEARATAVAARLETLPIAIEQMTAHLGDTTLLAPHTQVALGQLAGLEQLIAHDVGPKIGSASSEIRLRVAAAIPNAVAALEGLRVELDRRRATAKAPWRLGADAFARKLALTLQSDLSADEIHRLAWQEHHRVRREMAELARELHRPLFGRDANGPDHTVVKRVLAALSDDRVSPSALREAAEENLERLTQFVDSHAIVPLDHREVLEVIWTPPHQRGVAIAGLASPGPLEPPRPGLPSFYLVQPIPDDWPASVATSFLREYNRFMLEILSIHEAIPGHFVQLYYGKREPSKVRRVFPNGPFVEGWAVYMEHVMVAAGYAGAGPPEGTKRPKTISAGLWRTKTDEALRAKAIALHGLKFYLRSVTNAILDYEIHAKDMTEDEAMKLMTQGAYQQQGEARAKWVRAQVTSAQLSTYFVGAQAWLRLRSDAERRAGARFDMGAFHAEALSHGAPPVHRLPELLGR